MTFLVKGVNTYL